MLILLAGLVLFLGIHSIRVFADAWRSRQISRIGLMPWKGIYSVVSIVSFGLIIWGFSLERAVPVYLWIPPAWTRHVTIGLMLISFILLIAAYVPGNGIKARVGHPMLLAVKVWALAHLIANGTLADVILFGAFLVWSVVNFAVSRRRDRLAGVTYPNAGMARTVITVIVAAVAFVLFAHFGHMWLIGVNPLS